MKKFTLWCCLLLAFSQASFAELIVLSGIYNGTDLYIKNAATTTGVGYCIYEVRVNNRITSDETNAPVVGVNFRDLSLRPGQPVEIVIRCKEDCAIRVLNPEVLLSESTFEMESVLVNPDGHMEWATRNERGTLPFTIEQYKWKRWVKVGEVMGKGDLHRNTYVMDMALHSGTNVFRITQKDHSGMKSSNEVKVQGKAPQVQLFSTAESVQFRFSAETSFELYSEFGELVAKGRGSYVPVRGFPRGTYYLNYDNQAGVRVFVR